MSSLLTPKLVRTANERKTSLVTEQKISGEKLLPVFFVDEVKVGEVFDKTDWPLHITLFPPVTAQYTSDLGIYMREYINPIEPFEVRVNGEDTYGDPQSIAAGEGVPVYTVEKNRQLVAAHKGFVKALSHLPHDTTFRQPYNPHISKQHTHRELKMDEELYVEGLSIVTRDAGSAQWTVTDKMRFKGISRYI